MLYLVIAQLSIFASTSFLFFAASICELLNPWLLGLQCTDTSTHSAVLKQELQQPSVVARPCVAAAVAGCTHTATGREPHFAAAAVAAGSAAPRLSVAQSFSPVVLVVILLVCGFYIREQDIPVSP